MNDSDAAYAQLLDMFVQLERTVVELGQRCAVQISGDTDDAATVNTTGLALAAINEALRYGQRRNNQYNIVRLALERATEIHEHPDGMNECYICDALDA
jgi:hypothetical protein